MQCFLCQADEHADPLCASCMPLFKPVASGSSLPWTIGKTVTKIQQQTYGVVVELTDDVLVFAISEFQLCCESFDFELHESNLLPGDLLLSVTVEPTVQKEDDWRRSITVRMHGDSGGDLVFEAWCDHNGYYSHEFMAYSKLLPGHVDFHDDRPRAATDPRVLTQYVDAYGTVFAVPELMNVLRAREHPDAVCHAHLLERWAREICAHEGPWPTPSRPTSSCKSWSTAPGSSRAAATPEVHRWLDSAEYLLAQDAPERVHRLGRRHGRHVAGDDGGALKPSPPQGRAIVDEDFVRAAPALQAGQTAGVGGDAPGRFRPCRHVEEGDCIVLRKTHQIPACMNLIEGPRRNVMQHELDPFEGVYLDIAVADHA